MNHALEHGQFPSKFDFVDIVPAHKRGEPDQTGQYRFFALIDSLSRVLGRLVAQRLAECLEGWLRESCMGFVANFAIEDVIHVLRRMQEDIGYVSEVVFGA